MSGVRLAELNLGRLPAPTWDMRENGPAERAFGWTQLPQATAWRARSCRELAA